MSDTLAPTATSLEYEEVLTRIRRSNAETQKFIEESLKLSAEARKLSRDATFAPFTLGVTAFGAGAAMVAAVAAVLKLLGP